VDNGEGWEGQGRDVNPLKDSTSIRHWARLLSKLGILTLILLTWRIWWAHNNASRWQMGFNLAFKRLRRKNAYNTLVTYSSYRTQHVMICCMFTYLYTHISGKIFHTAVQISLNRFCGNRKETAHFFQYPTFKNTCFSSGSNKSTQSTSATRPTI